MNNLKTDAISTVKRVKVIDIYYSLINVKIDQLKKETDERCIKVLQKEIQELINKLLEV